MYEPPATTFGDGSEPYPRQNITPAWTSHPTSPPLPTPPDDSFTPAELSAALVDAVQRGNMEKLQRLVDLYRYDVNTPDKEDCSLLQWAALNNHVPVMRYLIEKGANVDYIGGELRATPLHWATFMGNLPAVVCLVQQGADAGVVNRDGCTTLHFAAQRGFSHIVAYLLGRGMDVNLRDQFGMTPLMWATKVAAMDPARLLVHMGADVNAKDRMHGNTALHWAVLNTNVSVCQLLLSSGADVDAVNVDNKTPLQLSLTEKRNRFVEEIIRTHRQERGLEGSWITRNILRNDRLVRGLFNSVPVLTFIFVGSVFTLNCSYFLKFLAIIIYALIVFYAGKWLHFSRFSEKFALAVYLGCKSCILLTAFFLWLPTVYSWTNILAWIILMGGLWYNFLRTWLGDPGFINPPKEDKLRAVVELAEKNEFSVAKLCTTCLVVRPLRSKHCSVCGKCVAVMDHHCPFTGNCVGRANHRFFVGYLVWLSMSGIGAVHTGLTYLGAVCGLESARFLLTIGPALECGAWSAFVIAFALLFTVWIGFLALMQLYQISVVAMTTNERINQHRYGHFRGEDGTRLSPFHKGFVGNCLEFWEMECFGLRRRWLDGKPYQKLNDENV
ncbi:palmitoyltransferase ZDHHC17-like [Paramacrobiotus metropolitanus]|uniref:palmitoyltransferase ZDHHC17-like n=1 Tax=Paramacrobiotus metropolitanus TaxID=2943436 RepID=UPI00244642F5|nr:palmitoyltransferase ZDHHC17-like [Paramacrobiotus metropolitanus]